MVVEFYHFEWVACTDITLIKDWGLVKDMSDFYGENVQMLNCLKCGLIFQRWEKLLKNVSVDHCRSRVPSSVC